MASSFDTSWEKVSSWYDAITAEEGHFYHREVILPHLLSRFSFDASSSLLDLACGQGVLARALPQHIPYLGIDNSPTLISHAKKHNASKNAKFLTADITKDLPLNTKFTHATCILALQNIENSRVLFHNLAKYLVKGGLFYIVLNHPCFRIPRQSSWGIDHQKKLQFRRMDSYSSSQKIPITTHPGKTRSSTTWSFHFSLADLFLNFTTAGFAVTYLTELTSPKRSTGCRARMENRARKEFPLFLCLELKLL